MRQVRPRIKNAILANLLIVFLVGIVCLVIGILYYAYADQREMAKAVRKQREEQAIEEQRRREAAQRQEAEAKRKRDEEWYKRLAHTRATTKPAYDIVLAPGEKTPCIQKPGPTALSLEATKKATVDYYLKADPVNLRSIDSEQNTEGDVGQFWTRNDSNEPNRVRVWFMPYDPSNTDVLANSARMEMKRAPDIVQTLEPRDMTEAIKLTGRGKSQWVLDVDGNTRVYCISGSENSTSMVRCCGYPCDMSSFQTCHHIRVLNDDEQKNVTVRLWFYNAYGETRREGLPGIDY